MISAWIVTSSAVVASSAMSSRGSQEIAIAIMTRCSMPPDSSAGIWWKTQSGRCRPTAASRSMLLRCASRRRSRCFTRSTSASWLPTVRFGFRYEAGSWNTAPMPVPCRRSQPRLDRSVTSWPLERDRAPPDGAALREHAEGGPAGERLAAA